MCRFFAYLGPSVSLEDLLVTPEHSLLRQASTPRHQRHGNGNPDGFGVGWYGAEVQPERYRTSTPMWEDRTFTKFAGQTRSTVVVGHVRNATPGLPIEESGAHPFTSGPWLFAHNGSVHGFCDGTRSALRTRVSEHRVAEIEGATDSEMLFALALDHLDAGAEPGAALAGVINSCSAISDDPLAHRLNMVLTDGIRLAATAWGDTLFVLEDTGLARGGVVVASEPADDHPAWEQASDRSLVEATATTLAVNLIAP